MVLAIQKDQFALHDNEGNDVFGAEQSLWRVPGGGGLVDDAARPGDPVVLLVGCGPTSTPWPEMNSADPIWSKKMNGPTIWRFGAGSARRTSKSPMSRARGTIKGLDRIDRDGVGTDGVQ